MRHLKSGRKLGRTSAHRMALYRGLVAQLLRRDKIQTSDAKAKEVRRIADRMVTLGKAGTLDARRRAAAFMQDKLAVQRLFAEVAPRFASRPGGYTRITKLGRRMGDAAPISVIELTGTSEAVAGAAAARRPRRRNRAEETQAAE